MAYKNKVIRNPVTRQEIKFLQTASDTGGKLLEMESTYFAHSTEPPSHYHAYQFEDFTVLEGEISARINGEIKTFKAGEHIHFPANTVHSMWNSSNQKSVVNWKIQPAMNTEHLLETGMGLANDGKVNDKGLPNILQVALMMNKFSDVFRLAKPPLAIQKIVFGVLSPIALLLGYRSSYKKYLD
jgi:quercetin dioxygenase-like cupin family protein